MSNRATQHDPFWMNVRAERLIWLVSILWLPNFIPPVVNLFQTHHATPQIVAVLTLLGVFLAVHLWAIWQDQRDVAVLQTDARPRSVVWRPIVVLAALSVALTLLGGAAWGSAFIQAGGTAARRLPLGQAVRTTGVLILLLVPTDWIGGVPLHDFLNTAFLMVVVGFTVAGVISAIVANRSLQAARQELARLAVTEERLRIARDLHDLLGHSLSLIALKSELAGRLVSAAPARAAAEIRDVEQTARGALHEVREAVSGYRQPTLAAELEGARELLAAAGIACRLDGAEGVAHGLPPAVESALAWAVREGVTNVIRHSRACACRIALSRDAGEIAVAVADDGRSATETPTATPGIGGNGLRGLAERVRDLGGRCEAGPRPEGGFQLAVTLPLARARRPAQAGANGANGARAIPATLETAGQSAGRTIEKETRP